MDARVTTLTVKGLKCINADWARTVSTLKSNHEVMMLVGYGQDDIVLSELAGYLVPDTFRTFNFYRLTRSARPLNGAYQSLKVSARLCHRCQRMASAGR